MTNKKHLVVKPEIHKLLMEHSKDLGVSVNTLIEMLLQDTQEFRMQEYIRRNEYALSMLDVDKETRLNLLSLWSIIFKRQMHLNIKTTGKIIQYALKELKE